MCRPFSFQNSPFPQSPSPAAHRHIPAESYPCDLAVPKRNLYVTFLIFLMFKGENPRLYGHPNNQKLS